MKQGSSGTRVKAEHCFKLCSECCPQRMPVAMRRACSLQPSTSCSTNRGTFPTLALQAFVWAGHKHKVGSGWLVQTPLSFVPSIHDENTLGIAASSALHI